MNRKTAEARVAGAVMAGRTADWRRRVAVFALAALLFNLFTPLVTLAVQSGIDGATPNASDSRAMPMAGCDKADMPAMGMGSGEKPRPGKGLCDGFCPLCTIGASYDLVRPVYFAPSPDAWSALPVQLPTDGDRPRCTIHALPSAPRAPPLDI